MSSTRLIRMPEDVATLVRGLPPEIKRKVRAGLDEPVHDPDAGKPLRDDLGGLRSLREGRFRIIDRINSPRVIDVVAVGPRRTICEEITRRLRR